MKQRNLTQAQISEYKKMNEEFKEEGLAFRIVYESPHQQAILTPPNPPTKEMVEKAQFIDKTYVWKHARVRSGDQRSAE